MDKTPAPRRLEAIAIGASAGGIEALGELLPALPAGLPAAIAVVLHIAPSQRSMLADIFADRCALPVLEASDKQPIEPGHVYFAPPDYHLLVESDRTWSLTQDEAVNFSRPSIDVLFDTAADVYGEALLGIVLSGYNNDGSAGVHAIRRAGGVNWAQDPDTAFAPDMPRSAIATGAVDAVLPLARMAAAMAALGRASAGEPADKIQKEQ
ncbi:chemotaxis protein CheB [Pigmentiphaga sp. NML080357]|uniref:chemotaxis protein CheB n=1 Tax=Pigmentiphaga sp. NML080357 TaxID=2008675 RepID=UPI000B4230CC|nr:chemotaxis protein CheB [Pigmentiphaga sp. NML080357]OVZ54372.1 chemotaxis protein CheB [Pigmentiphaga sp. NML080357]